MNRRDDGPVSAVAFRRVRDPLLLFAVPDHLRSPRRLRRVRGIVADRLRLPRHALGARASAPRRRADLSGADARGGCRWQPLGLPAALHPPVGPARPAARGRRVVALVLPARRRRARRDVDRRRPRLALLRPRRHVAGRRSRPVLRQPHGAPRPSARARVALPRSRAGRRRSPSARPWRPSCSSGRSSSGCC